MLARRLSIHVFAIGGIPGVMTDAGVTDAPRITARGRRRIHLAPYLFISPFYLLFAVFFVFPLGFAVYLSFNMWDQATPMRFVGLNNYTHLFIDPYFWQAVLNTLVYVMGSLLISFCLSLPLALALNSRQVFAKSVLRTLYFTPIVMPSAAIAIVFNLVYSKDFGLLNSFLHLFGIPGVDWLNSQAWSKVAVLGMVAWQWIGLNSMYFLAGLQSISQNLYEAAALDGASAWQSIRYVTLPMLAPMSLFVLITTFVGSAQIFDQPFILTGGGPINSSLSYAMYLYQQGLSFLHLGYAAAMGILLLIVVAAISWFQYRRLSTD